MADSSFAHKYIQQSPHCDQRILHEPGKCEYCDMHPEWQALRILWGIAFTGGPAQDEYGKPLQPCPAEAARPLEIIERWYGNVPHQDR
jgi:hypothetical protein